MVQASVAGTTGRERFMKQVVYSLLLLVGLVDGCVVADARDEQPLSADPPAIEAEVKQSIARLQADWNSGDMEAYLATYWNDPGLSMMTGGTALRGWQAIADLFRATWTTEPAMGDFSALNVAVGVLDDRTAIASGGFQHVFQHETVEGVFTHVWRRFGERWLIVHEHTSRAASHD